MPNSTTTNTNIIYQFLILKSFICYVIAWHSVCGHWFSSKNCLHKPTIRQRFICISQTKKNHQQLRIPASQTESDVFYIDRDNDLLFMCQRTLYCTGHTHSHTHLYVQFGQAAYVWSRSMYDVRVLFHLQFSVFGFMWMREKKKIKKRIYGKINNKCVELTLIFHY